MYDRSLIVLGQSHYNLQPILMAWLKPLLPESDIPERLESFGIKWLPSFYFLPPNDFYFFNLFLSFDFLVQQTWSEGRDLGGNSWRRDRGSQQCHRWRDIKACRRRCQSDCSVRSVYWPLEGRHPWSNSKIINAPIISKKNQTSCDDMRVWGWIISHYSKIEVPMVSVMVQSSGWFFSSSQLIWGTLYEESNSSELYVKQNPKIRHFIN